MALVYCDTGNDNFNNDRSILMILETSIRNLEELYDDFIKNYEMGNFTEGVCRWNGDDALMGPRSFAHKFKKRAEEMGFNFCLLYTSPSPRDIS